jgi:glutaredoxin 3
MADILMYSSAICPYCLAAKNFLKSKGLGYREVRIDLDAAARKEMMDKAKRTSVPQIFVNGAHIGGFDEMVAMDRAGNFAALLEQAL